MKSPSKKLNLALIGAGGISQSQHLPNLQRAQRIDLKTVCDLNAGLLAAARARYGIPRATQSFQEVLEDGSIDAILIATRSDTHSQLAVEALEAGKHVYVEKPLGETEEECARVIAARERSGKHLAVAFNRRMAPAYQLGKKILEAHGGAKIIHYRMADSFYLWGPAAGIAPGTRILHEVCHVFDLLRFLTASDAVSIYCAAARDDDESVLVQFANGSVATILSSGYATYDFPKEHLEAIVKLGALTVSDFVELRTYGLDDFEPVYRFAGHTHPDRDVVHRYLLESGGEETMLQLRRAYYRAWKARADPDATEYLNHHAPHLNYMMNKGWLEAVEHFAETILDGTPSQLATAEDGLQATRLCEAAIRSREEKRVVVFTGNQTF